MSNISPQSNSSSIDAVYAQLNQRDIEEFYAGYQRWGLQQQIAALQTRLDDLRQQIADNTERIQQVHPTAIALATLARLQSNGVSDVALLDRMLEQGELWLDRTMQRLDYFEKLDDFISDGYTQWCKHALEGAYEWIDSVLDGNSSSLPPEVVPGEVTLTEATEELILLKLSSDEYEDESSMLETTLKRPAIIITHPEEPALSVEDVPVAVEAVPIVEEPVPAPEEVLTGDATPASDLPVEEAAIQEHRETEVAQTLEEVPSFEERLSAEEITTLDTEQQTIQEHVTQDFNDDTAVPVIEEPVLQDSLAPEESLSLESSSISDSEHSLQNMTPKRPNLITRLIEKIWGS